LNHHLWQQAVKTILYNQIIDFASVLFAMRTYLIVTQKTKITNYGYTLTWSGLIVKHQNRCYEELYLAKKETECLLSAHKLSKVASFTLKD
jgi:hypothetical protein